MATDKRPGHLRPVPTQGAEATAAELEHDAATQIPGLTPPLGVGNSSMFVTDVIVELGGMKVENIYDYTYAIEALKIGEEIGIVVNRGGERVEMKITPAPRE